jgi:lysophospholipase L1-like esterase
MKKIYLYLLLLWILFLLFLLFFLFFLNGIKEGMNRNSYETILLLGDSILKNNAYVGYGSSIEDQVERKTKKKVFNLASDYSFIHDVYSQLDRIPYDWNDPSTIIFLSVGGNDLLYHYKNQENSEYDLTMVTQLSNHYQDLVTTIQKRMNECKIVLLDLYTPSHPKFNQYKGVIQEWNRLLQEYSNKQSLNSFLLIPTSRYLIQKDDFSHEMEPSETGGKKIAELIFEISG